MSPIKFLAPIKRYQNYAINRVVDDIRAAIDLHNPKQLSVIAHSFGTYVIAQIIKEYPEFKWRRIIFCGSVVKSDFNINDFSDHFDPPLLNEVGLSDWWPAFAEKGGWYYGSVGSNGFSGALVETRWHKQVTHSGFVTEKFCKRYWIPYLKHGRVITANYAEPMPLLIRVLTWPPYRYVLLMLYFLLFVAAPLAAVSASLYFIFRML